MSRRSSQPQRVQFINGTEKGQAHTEKGARTQKNRNEPQTSGQEKGQRFARMRRGRGKKSVILQATSVGANT